jgi:hypothetical protein
LGVVAFCSREKVLRRGMIAWTVGVAVTAMCLAALSSTAGAAPPSASAAAGQTSNAKSDPFVDCAAQIAKDPQYAELAKKLPVKDGQVSAQMLADDSVAMGKELPVLKSLYERHKKCWTDSADFRQLHLPPEVLKMVNDGGAAMFGIGADLYNQKISFGEANQRLQAVGSSLDAEAAEITKQYQAELSALSPAEAAQQGAPQTQRQQQVQSYVKAPPQLAVPLHPINTSCQPSGGTTNCVTQ